MKFSGDSVGFFLTAGLALLASGCLDLDGFIHNPVHCSTVGPETCEDSGVPSWDQVCVPCEEDYDWVRDYDWIEGTLDEGTPSVRPVETLVESSTLASEDGEAALDVLFIPSHGGVPELATTTVLYNHGNYAGIEHYQPRLRFLHEAGYNLVVWDFRGYGKSTPDSAPSPEQFLTDAATFRDYAAGYAPDPERIVVYGNSLGGIPAVEMALDPLPCALMLETPFTSMSRISGSNSGTSFPESFFSQGRYDNVAKLEGFEAPLLVMIGENDNKFPVEHMEEMVEGAAGPRELWVVPGAKHGLANGGIPETGLTPYFETMSDFLQDQAPDCVGAVFSPDSR